MGVEQLRFRDFVAVVLKGLVVDNELVDGHEDRIDRERADEESETGDDGGSDLVVQQDRIIPQIVAGQNRNRRLGVLALAFLLESLSWLGYPRKASSRG